MPVSRFFLSLVHSSIRESMSETESNARWMHHDPDNRPARTNPEPTYEEVVALNREIRHHVRELHRLCDENGIPPGAIDTYSLIRGVLRRMRRLAKRREVELAG